MHQINTTAFEILIFLIFITLIWKYFMQWIKHFMQSIWNFVFEMKRIA